MSGRYDTAQVCRNGHVINSRYTRCPQFRQNFCGECGEAAITRCEQCGADIHGSHFSDGPVLGSPAYAPPRYRHACGKPYPWTSRKLQSARDSISELKDLIPEDQRALIGSLEELAHNGTQGEVALPRFKKLVRKLGHEAYEAFKKVVTDVLSESAKKAIFGP